MTVTTFSYAHGQSPFWTNSIVKFLRSLQIYGCLQALASNRRWYLYWQGVTLVYEVKPKRKHLPFLRRSMPTIVFEFLFRRHLCFSIICSLKITIFITFVKVTFLKISDPHLESSPYKVSPDKVSNVMRASNFNFIYFLL